MCLIAFIGLNKLPQVKRIYVCNFQNNNSPNEITKEEETQQTNQSTYDHSRLLEGYTGDMGIKILLCILVLLNAFQNGITSSISSYTFAPYGILTYHLAVTLGSISSSFACFIYLWVPCKSKNVIYID